MGLSAANGSLRAPPRFRGTGAAFGNFLRPRGDCGFCCWLLGASFEITSFAGGGGIDEDVVRCTGVLGAEFLIGVWGGVVNTETELELDLEGDRGSSGRGTGQSVRSRAGNSTFEGVMFFVIREGDEEGPESDGHANVQ